MALHNATCDQGTIGAPRYLVNPNINTGFTPYSNSSYEAMLKCCAPNEVNWLGDCALWCELPKELTEGDADLGDQFHKCLKDNSESHIQTSDVQKASEGNLARPLCARDVALLTLCLTGFIFAAV